ncbi:uncharacterized protein LTR77_004045 [Saxophila tyrrhenica]|uniref:Uncharacterized protein n=1 Tax=Saxophila tyrrhenica TaxID=1690608 RepID=A0AAV9PCH5_9PEZI|nr:hypothetical protein LTR77_004045 [Saxophila tyrrhenica]
MNCNQGKPTGHLLASKPSSAFSTTSSAASATSVGTSRSGGSRLLFGEIDTSSDRSSGLYASVCSFVLCDSSTFLKFWLEDKCRDTFLSCVPKEDLASLRLACHDFSVRAAPALFNDLAITFRASTFTRPARLAALDRLGFYVKTLRFNVPHSPETFLPPLVDPETGAELSFTYTPQIEASTAKRPKYGDIGTTEILTRQWPTLFHAATNVPAFIRAFSAFVNLSHLKVSCPGYNQSQQYRRSTVDFALISLRIAVEQNNLNALDTLTLSPIHPGGILHLSPILGYGATPRSSRRWSRIKNLTLHVVKPRSSPAADEPDHFKLLQTYIRNFQSNLTTFKFRWIGSKGLIPIHRQRQPFALTEEHPASRTGSDHEPPAKRRALPPLHFPKLQHAEFENSKAAADDIAHFCAAHKRTIEELNFDDVELTSGTWDEALGPVTKRQHASRRSEDTADIPIMLSPTTRLPAVMERLEITSHQESGNGRKSLRMSRWLSKGRKAKAPPPTPSSRPHVPATRPPVLSSRRPKDGLLGSEGQLRRALRGGMAAWRGG